MVFATPILNANLKVGLKMEIALLDLEFAVLFRKNFIKRERSSDHASTSYFLLICL